MSKTKIEWTQHTWNPTVGCSIVSPGCTNCYAMNLAYRVECINAEAAAKYKPEPSPQYNGTTKRVNGRSVWTGRVAFSEKALDIPLRRRVPTTYFVNSMSDLFHEDVPDEWIDKVFAVMALTPRHTYQVLTKRSARMRAYCTSRSEPKARLAITGRMNAMGAGDKYPIGHRMWPLPNVWLGVSTERQKEADERIPDLLAAPAAVRFISAEPLLGPIVLDDVCDGHKFMDFLRGNWWHDCDPPHIERGHPKLDWVIVGGESGPGARPMHPDWARSLRDQCQEAGVPYFFKQHGSWAPVDEPASETQEDEDLRNVGVMLHGQYMRNVGKAKAGRLLDGREHNGSPGGQHANQ